MGTMSAASLVIADVQSAAIGLWSQIPRGRVATYGDLADALGDRVAARWVGHYALNHDHRAGCPCHRLVRADGTVGGHVDGEAAKARVLRKENVPWRGGRVDLEACRFTQFRTRRPLAALRAAQEAAAGRVRIAPLAAVARTVGGVDTSYIGPHQAVAAYVLLPRGGDRPVWSTSIRHAVAFPYISSFLSFRELPLLLELLDRVRQAGRLPDVLLVDGSGILHPRRIGLAAHLGVEADVPTIGVTKRHLVGRVERRQGWWQAVSVAGQVVGAAMRGGGTSRKPIYVSPGHRADVATAADTVAACLAGHRLPEPLYWADRLSRDEAAGAVASGPQTAFGDRRGPSACNGPPAC